MSNLGLRTCRTHIVLCAETEESTALEGKIGVSVCLFVCLSVLRWMALFSVKRIPRASLALKNAILATVGRKVIRYGCYG